MRQMTVKTEPFVKAGIPRILAEHQIRINHYAETFFAHPAFSALPGGEMTVMIAALREIGLEEGGTLAEIIEKVRSLGGRPCPPAAGFYLRLAWPDQPQSGDPVLSGTHRAPDQAVTVLSGLFEQDESFPRGLYLRNVGGVLWLRGYVCDDTYRFSADDMFAFEAGGLKAG